MAKIEKWILSLIKDHIVISKKIW